jgi:GNAT acetyltransferase-like protein
VLARENFLRLPPNISHKLDLPGDWSLVEQRFLKRKSTRDEIRKIEKYGLSYRATRDRAAAERFYDTMYMPYARRRHGELLDVDPREVVVKLGTTGALLEVMHGERVIAGGVLQQIDRRMRFLWLGILDGLDPGLRDAAGASLYCFAIRHSIAAGCRELDLMYAPADLNNGIHRYKRKLGSRVSNDWPYGQLLVKVARLTPPVLTLFANMPIAAAGADNALHARITVDQENLSPDDVRRMASYYACEGLERLKIFSGRPLRDDVLRMNYAALDAGLPALELHDLTRSADPAAEFCAG